MKGSNRLVSIGFGWIVFALLLSACAVRTPVEQNTEPVNPELLRNTCVVLREFSTNAYAQNGEMAMTQCKNSAYQYLRSKGLFKAVENASDKSCDSPVLFVDARLIDLRIVSKAARFWGGAFSGRSHMKIFVEITDQEGQAIAQQELFGAPNAMGAAWSFGASDTNLPHHMGRLLADYVLAEASKITKSN